MSRLYDTDFTAWVDDTAQLLTQRRFEEVDLEALIEEVESLGASERRAYRSFLRLIIEHLLKLIYAPSVIHRADARRWRVSVVDGRTEIENLLEDNASAARDRDKALASAYRQALKTVRYECDDFGPIEWPDSCPWTIEQLLDDEFWPEQENA